MRSGGPHHIGSAELFQFAKGCVPAREAGDALEGRDGSGREVLLFVRKANPEQKMGPPDGQKSDFGKPVPIWDGWHAWVTIFVLDNQTVGSWYANCLIPNVRSDRETHGDGQTNSIFTQTYNYDNFNCTEIRASDLEE